jgi:hypothetical protein
VKGDEMALPPSVAAHILANPDTADSSHFIRVQEGGQAVCAVPLLLYTIDRYDPQRGGPFFNYAAMRFAVTRPREFFWAAGALSSVLDNAPTYLTFVASAAGLEGLPAQGRFVGALALHPGASRLLEAISTGAVFMGAMTYIGNAPNFMVRAIAEENGITMPSFFGYMAYSCGILLPLFVAITAIFF